MLMTTKMYGFRATHPGEVLKEEIKYRRISQKELAAQMGMSYNILNDILNGRRSITESTAMLFEAALDIPADSLLTLQHKFNMQKIRSDKSFMSRLDSIRHLVAAL